MSHLLIELSGVCKNFAERVASGASTADGSGAAGAGTASAVAVTAHNNNTGSVAMPHKRPSVTETAGNNNNNGSGSNDSTLLVTLARFFRKRLFKIWEKIIESDRISFTHTATNLNLSLQGLDTSLPSAASVATYRSDAAGLLGAMGTGPAGPGQGQGQGMGLALGLPMEIDESAPYMKYIEDTAFRVPMPRASGGALLCCDLLFVCCFCCCLCFLMVY
jgi:hypothetical protein